MQAYNCIWHNSFHSVSVAATRFVVLHAIAFFAPRFRPFYSGKMRRSAITDCKNGENAVRKLFHMAALAVHSAIAALRQMNGKSAAPASGSERNAQTGKNGFSWAQFVFSDRNFFTIFYFTCVFLFVPSLRRSPRRSRRSHFCLHAHCALFTWTLIYFAYFHDPSETVCCPGASEDDTIIMRRKSRNAN